MKLLEQIGKIFETSEGCKLEEKCFDQLSLELGAVSAYLDISPTQSFFFSTIFSLNYTGSSIDFGDLVKHFKCNPPQLLKYHKDFKVLETKQLVQTRRPRRLGQLAGANCEYSINGKVSEAILNNEKMLVEQSDRGDDDAIDVLERINQLIEEKTSDDIFSLDLLRAVNLLVKTNEKFLLFRKINDLKLSRINRLNYLYLIWETITGSESVRISDCADILFDNQSAKIRYTQDILNNINPMTRLQLIDIEPHQWYDRTSLKLSGRSLDMLEDCGIKLFAHRKKNDNVIIPTDIPERQLIYKSEEMKQLELLKALMSEDKLKETQTRLIDKSLPKGIPVLLHGAPGTGKTESVLQIAKSNNREIVKVDISQSKSMWFGESEKLIKKIFTDYKKYAESCERTPILLFNEADALISKRQQSGNSNVQQTENAIQNILLEEIENFEGILIATTNLAANLDTAFERRFLFKIKFEKPDSEVKSQIWQMKMPDLTRKNCQLLGRTFDLSGGQIDNIVRKNEIHEIIHGKAPSFDGILNFCQEEILGNHSAKIGFAQLA